MLLDCGEAAQIQMMRFGLRSFRLDVICISHLHPDHYLGLIGLLSSLSLRGRQKELTLIAPDGIKEIVDVHIRVSEIFLNYVINFIPLEQQSGMYEVCKIKGKDQEESISISAFPVSHRVPCWGFLIKSIGPTRKIDNSKLKKGAGLSTAALKAFQEGRDYNGLRHVDYTTVADPRPCYAYITDTLFLPRLAETIKEYRPSTLYHEATYLSELEDKAVSYFHSTAEQAATMAKLMNVNELLIGHFSSRYQDLVPLLQEAQKIFPNTRLAIEGESFSL